VEQFWQALRLDDDYIYLNRHAAQPKTAATSVDGVLDDASSSQNAQFRAIQPLPEILRHIDTHVCPPFPNFFAVHEPWIKSVFSVSVGS